MNKELQKVYEMMAKLSPEFKLNEADSFDSSFGDSFNAPDLSSTEPNSNVASDIKPSATNTSTNNINQSSIVDDGTLSVGELKTCIQILTKSKTKDEALERLKSVGGDVLKIGVGMIPIVGNIIGTGMDVAGIMSKIFKPKKENEPDSKTPNEFMRLLQIDKEVSILLDDNIEYAFIKHATEQLESLPDTTPIPDFFNMLKEFIKEKYSAYYNLIKS